MRENLCQLYLYEGRLKFGIGKECKAVKTIKMNNPIHN